jgi:hypothetical protein
MWFVWTMRAALADDPAVEDSEARARALSRVGAVELTTGIAALAGGVVVMIVGRGSPGEISNESQRVSDLRSAGGAALIIGGFTTALVGGNNLGRARGYRRLGEDVTVGAAIDRRGAAVRVSGTF